MSGGFLSVGTVFYFSYVQCVVCSTQYAMYKIQYAVWSMHCGIVCSVQCAAHIMRFAVFSAVCSMPCIVFGVHYVVCTIYCVHYAMCTKPCAVHSMPWTLRSRSVIPVIYSAFNQHRTNLGRLKEVLWQDIQEIQEMQKIQDLQVQQEINKI